MEESEGNHPEPLTQNELEDQVKNDDDPTKNLQTMHALGNDSNDDKEEEDSFDNITKGTNHQDDQGPLNDESEE